MLPVEFIVRQTAEYFGFGPMELLRPPRWGDRRGHHARKVAQARHVAMWLARELMRGRPNGSFPEIGKVLRRHHTSVMYGVEKAARAMNRDGVLHAKVMRLHSRLRADPAFSTTKNSWLQSATVIPSTGSAERAAERIVA